MTYSRRKFIQIAGVTAATGMLGIDAVRGSVLPWRSNNDTLKVGLIGCGGRGTEAAVEALNADPNVVLSAMADAFSDHVEHSYNSLKERMGDQVQVAPDKRFVGLDAYEKLLSSDVDVVLLAAPPAFRPAHLEASVAAGKHIFCEKPFAVDGPGLRKAMEAAKAAKSKQLALVSGFCWRYHLPKREAFAKVLQGQIGNVLAAESALNTGELWYKQRQPKWTDFEYQLRNWLYYNWLSGDHIVEQAIHSLDMMQWALGEELPIRATGSGGRQKRIDPKYGNIYDHFSVVYEYEGGRKSYFACRQQNDTAGAYAVELVGDKGKCVVDCRTGEHSISGQHPWQYADETKFTDADAYKRTASRGMYQQEHDELFASIRSNKPKYDGDYMMKSNLVALAGRTAAYTGQTVSIQDVLNSNEVFFPDNVSWDTKYDLPISIPGMRKTI